MTALHDLPAQDLLAAYRQRTLSPVEVTQAVLAHMARWEPHIRATYLLRPELTLIQARASEARWRAGQPLSALDGVPMTLKDNIATAGDPMPLGTAATDLSPMAADAPPAARLLLLRRRGRRAAAAHPRRRRALLRVPRPVDRVDHHRVAAALRAPAFLTEARRGRAVQGRRRADDHRRRGRAPRPAC